MNIHRIHQFSFATSTGSGVTNSLFYTQKMLRELGFVSEIFARDVAPELKGLVHDAADLQDDPHTLILVHHCLGYDNTDTLFSLSNPKVMVYHNITPPELLPPNSEIGRYAVLGREQLAQWNTRFIGAIGDSKLNTRELSENAYLNPVTIPMLVDLEKNSQLRISTEAAQQWSFLRDSYNMLFVGRICENKNQAELIEVLAHLSAMSNSRCRLILAGETTSPEYADFLRQEVIRWNLEDQVVFTGKLSEEALLSLYRQADVFVCLSAHEGFGMPLIEAMQHGMPVIARQSSSIADTLGGAGWLLEAATSAHRVASAVLTLMSEPALRRNLLHTQAIRVSQFARKEIKRQLSHFLAQLKITSPQPVLETECAADEIWQVEGPFDSSYSLAIVNRELARALHRDGVQTSLRSHEGHGDFAPSSQFLSEDVECADLHAAGEHNLGSDRYPNVALRFCYPPYANDMPAGLRAVHSYGWEETGFPQAYVEEFNRRLDLVTVLSESVAKVLRDSGVRVPIAVTGAGVDHLLHTAAEELPSTLMQALKKFRFLHISSSFPRKGIDVLLRAYGQAFSAADDVSLVIKTFPNPHNRVAELLDDCRRQNPDYPHVELINEDWPQARMVSLYRHSHAFVAPSRGEGFGLPLAEAMLFDLPVITTAWGGQRDFCNEETSWLCDYQFAKADTHLGLTHSLWAEPDVNHLAARMKEVFSANKVVYAEKLVRAKRNIEQNFTWARTAQKVRAAVQAVQAQTRLRDEPKIAWISTWNARCGIANYSQFLTQALPQDRLLVLANHIPERMGIDQDNVIRCWNAQQSEDFEYVLMHILEQGIKAVVLQYNFGFLSVPNLAEFLKKLKSYQIDAYVFFHSTADVKIAEQMVSLSSIKSTLSDVERLFVHSVDDMNRLKAWGLVDNVTYFPHGVAAAPEVPVARAAKFAESKVIASYGFLLPHKGIKQLIEAFANLDHASQNYHLLLVNSIYPDQISYTEADACRELIRTKNLETKVSFITDFLSDAETHALLSNADLIVFPYQQTQESSSAAVRVGLATGRPVAVTPLSIFDDVKEAVTYLKGTDSTSMAESLTVMLDAQASDLALREEARTWFAERNWKVLAQRLLNTIDGIANKL